MANQSTAREQSDHHEQVSPQEDDFTDKEDGTSWTLRRASNNNNRNVQEGFRKRKLINRKQGAEKLEKDNRRRQHESSSSEKHYKDLQCITGHMESRISINK